MRFFRMEEFACRCCGQLPPFAKENVEALVAEVLDPLRERLGRPIRVNSGYRCAERNAAVGGATGSQHLKGEAADICGRSPEENMRMARMLMERRGFDQLIIERCDKAGNPMWLHVSYKRTGVNRNMVLWE